MTNPTELPGLGDVCTLPVKIGNVSEILNAISRAVAKRAYEIYQFHPRRPGHDREDWLLAEKEVLQPLSCWGILNSKSGVVVSAFCSALGVKDLADRSLC
jgi:hypothetical protein